jgi:crossover junction endodeoxyribonuclease RuvC
MLNKKAPQTLRIIGIDPGYERLGIAVIERKEKQPDRLLFSECFKTSAKLDFTDRLLLLGQEIARVLAEYQPQVMGIETLFLDNNHKSAMFVSEARGVIEYEAAKNGLKIYQFSPMQIKSATTGYGQSDKSQVVAMIPRLIKIEKEIQHDDEYDAIACAITCIASYRA